METQSVPGGQLRVSDADRDRAIADLSQHFQAGRLTQEEFEDRTGQALQARTRKDLGALFTDLPHNRAPEPGPVQPYRAPIGGIAVAAGVILVAVSVLGGARSGHPALFGLVPVLIVLLVVRCVVRRRRI